MHLWFQYRPSVHEENEFNGFCFDLLMALVQNCWCYCLKMKHLTHLGDFTKFCLNKLHGQRDSRQRGDHFKGTRSHLVFSTLAFATIKRETYADTGLMSYATAFITCMISLSSRKPLQQNVGVLVVGTCLRGQQVTSLNECYWWFWVTVVGRWSQQMPRGQQATSLILSQSSAQNFLLVATAKRF